MNGADRISSELRFHPLKIKPRGDSIAITMNANLVMALMRLHKTVNGLVDANINIP